MVNLHSPSRIIYLKFGLDDTYYCVYFSTPKPFAHYVVLIACVFCWRLGNLMQAPSQQRPSNVVQFVARSCGAKISKFFSLRIRCLNLTKTNVVLSNSVVVECSNGLENKFNFNEADCTHYCDCNCRCREQ